MMQVFNFLNARKIRDEWNIFEGYKYFHLLFIFVYYFNLILLINFFLLILFDIFLK